MTPTSSPAWRSGSPHRRIERQVRSEHPARLRRRAAVWLLPGAVAALLLAGCAVTPPLPDTTVTLPERFHYDYATEAAPGSLWVAQEPTLVALFAAVRAANPEREAAVARWAQAVALAEAAAAQARGVNVTGTANERRAENSRALVPNAAVTTQWQLGANLQWDPDLFGGAHAAARAAQLRSEAAEWEWQRLERQLLFQAAQAYLDAVAARERLALTARQIESVAESRALIAARVTAGLAGERELAQNEALAAQLRAQEAQQQLQYALAVERLVMLTGGDRAGWGSPPPLAQPALPDAAPAQLPADAVRRRPEVAKAERQLAAAVADLTRAHAARYPSFPLSGSLLFAAANPAALWQMSAASWSLAWNLSVSLFDSGRLAAEERAAGAAVREAAANYRAAVVAAVADVEQALVQLRDNDARRDALTAAEAAAGRAVRLLDAQYRAGLVDYALVLDAQRTWLAAQQALLDAVATSRSDRLTLEYRLGVPW